MRTIYQKFARTLEDISAEVAQKLCASKDLDFLIDYVNTRLSLENTLVVLVIERLEQFPLLQVFLKYLPFNFRCVILSCAQNVPFPFGLKRNYLEVHCLQDDLVTKQSRYDWGRAQELKEVNHPALLKKALEHFQNFYQTPANVESIDIFLKIAKLQEAQDNNRAAVDAYTKAFLTAKNIYKDQHYKLVELILLLAPKLDNKKRFDFLCYAKSMLNN